MIAPHERLIIVSGCSGGGKSSLIAHLARQGHATVAEPGRRIIASGGPKPWENLQDFLWQAVKIAIADRTGAIDRGATTFFDRGLIDAALGLERLTGDTSLRALCRAHPYAPFVFLAPPWREIYVNDAERPHSFDQAVSEYEALAAGYPALGYDVIELPRLGIEDRAAFVIETVDARIGQRA